MDKELIILEQIQNNPHVNQRDLASIAKASLGMTNAILKRFAAKGFITIRKVNNRNILYALTPAGIEEINRRSWNYFKRTIKNVVDYQDAIREIVKQARVDGYEGVALVGNSDFAFIVEHVCYKEGIDFHVCNDMKRNKLFYLLAENSSLGIETEVKSSFSLSRLIVK